MKSQNQMERKSLKLIFLEIFFDSAEKAVFFLNKLTFFVRYNRNTLEIQEKYGHGGKLNLSFFLEITLTMEKKNLSI